MNFMKNKLGFHWAHLLWMFPLVAFASPVGMIWAVALWPDTDYWAIPAIAFLLLVFGGGAAESMGDRDLSD